MFRTRQRASHGISRQTLVEATTSCMVDASIEEAWAEVSDPAVPVIGLENPWKEDGYPATMVEWERSPTPSDEHDRTSDFSRTSTR